MLEVDTKVNKEGMAQGWKWNLTDQQKKQSFTK